jgi:hypothetical protein
MRRFQKLKPFENLPLIGSNWLSSESSELTVKVAFVKRLANNT